MRPGIRSCRQNAGVRVREFAYVGGWCGVRLVAGLKEGTFSQLALASALSFSP